MTHIRIRICIVITGIVLGITAANAKNPTKESSKKDVYQHLWETKNILSVEVSPDDKHLLVSYFAPILSSPEMHLMDYSSDDVSSAWITIDLIKKNYKDQEKTSEKVYNQTSLDCSSWTPDSQNISYISQGDNNLSLWVTSTQEFKPEKILELESDIIGYQWSPNGKRIAVLVNQKISADAIKFVADVDQLYSIKLYVLDIDEKLTTSNLTVLRSDTVLPDVYKANANKSLKWSPDSQHIAYNYSPLSKGKPTTLAQIDLINVTTKAVKSSAKGEGTNLFPNISLDGKYLAYVTNILSENANNPIRVYGTDASGVCVIELANNEKYCLAQTPNENPKLVGWKKDSKAVFVVDQQGLTTQIYELDLEGKSAVKFTTGQQILEGVQVNATGEFIGYATKDFKTPAQVYITPTNNFNPEKITSFSNSQINEHIVTEEIRWKSKDQKFDLEGVFIYPKKGEFPFPLITILNDYSITVTDLGYVGDFTGYPISLLSLLEKGYAIFIPNRRGANGYGVKFRQALYKELGGEEFQDVLSGIDTLITQKKADTHKLALWGWGYGGYLSAWALTQTERFKTIIVGAGISNLISQVGTSTDSSLLRAIMGSSFWEDWKTWREKSPISHVKNMKTPTFIQTGDGIVDYSQSEELFFPLKTKNVPVQMIDYLKQEHTFYTPHVILMGIQDLEAWLVKHFGFDSNSQEKGRK